MSIPHVKYLLIGGGLASSAAAQAIREIDSDGSCILIAQEISRPYHRPPLSKEYLRHQVPREKLFTLPSEWFESHRVSLRTGCRAARLDTARMSITLDNGQDISFDRLLLATGGSPLRLEIPGTACPMCIICDRWGTWTGCTKPSTKPPPKAAPTREAEAVRR